MNYKTFLPSAQLAGLVRSYWVLESEEAYTHHSMPDSCPELLFHYHGRFNELLADGRMTSSFVAGVHGQSDRARQFNIQSGFGIFGVYFYPHALPLLFGQPAAAFSNEMPDLSLLLTPADRHLEERIMIAEDNLKRIEIIEEFMLQKLVKNQRKSLPVFQVIQSIIQQKGLTNVKQMAAESFLSERQLSRQFREYAGFSPKLFSRLVRFQSAMEMYQQPGVSLTQIAHLAGYYDQSHFIHEFKAFSGQHPRNYFSGNSPATSWRD